MAYLLPPESLLLDPPILRYVLAAVVAFAPVFLANLVFTYSFRDTTTADMAFASNLLGAMVGGALEYLALLTGYQALLLVVARFTGWRGCSPRAPPGRRPGAGERPTRRGPDRRRPDCGTSTRHRLSLRRLEAGGQPTFGLTVGQLTVAAIWTPSGVVPRADDHRRRATVGHVAEPSPLDSSSEFSVRTATS